MTKAAIETTVRSIGDSRLGGTGRPLVFLAGLGNTAHTLDKFAPNRQADAFTAAIPGAHVVRLPNADHYVFRSNEVDVVQEMNAFLTFQVCTPATFLISRRLERGQRE
jgi:hypothetical protein